MFRMIQDHRAEIWMKVMPHPNQMINSFKLIDQFNRIIFEIIELKFNK